MVTKSESIKRFLQAKTHPDLASLYSLEMEVQVNVAQDDGERIEGEYRGVKWNGYTDNLTTWKPIRIPWNANSEPEYVDSDLRWDIAHADAIGMTGWNWFQQASQWVAFDFDSLVNHQKGLTNEELESIRAKLFELEWVTIRKSTSGTGLHVYIFLNDIPTKNHTEHAALARAVLGKISALVGYDFSAKVDTCGGNMWVWARKMTGTDGLTLIKAGLTFPTEEIPLNWKDHVKVVTGSRKKNLPQFIGQQVQADLFEELSGQRPRVPLDSEHQKLIAFLKESNAVWWWEQDHHMLVTHTIHLQEAHDSLSLKGHFKTISSGKEKGHDHNCFLFPMRKGAWVVRRYSPGASEHDSWDQDTAGWTRTYLNREPDLGLAARAYNGLEDTTGAFEFKDASAALAAAALLGVQLDIPSKMLSRPAKLKKHRDGRLIVEINQETGDGEMKGWLGTKKKTWVRICNANLNTPTEPEVSNFDDLVRHLVTEVHEDYGWTIKTDGAWGIEPLTHVKVALASLNLGQREITEILGSGVFKPWKLVNKPFESEYPGDREWNRNAAQLRFTPTNDRSNLNYPTWLKVLRHCGAGLDEAVKEHGWCRANGILTGADWLKCWISSLFKEPKQPLPYLFFYGPENTGKSIFHEALGLLLTKGYKRADTALTSQGGFNAELEGALICVVEEINLSRNQTAFNRIKDWVTGKDLLVHRKGETPYHIPNTTHWIQVANDKNYCQVFPGDTRITMVYVDALDPIDLIPKKLLVPLLEKEAPDFLAEILNMELPVSNDRLNVPVVETSDKEFQQRINSTPLQEFLREKIVATDGCKILISEFYDQFTLFCDPNERSEWSKRKVSKEMPRDIVKGRSTKDPNWYYGNIWWKDREPPPDRDKGKYVLNGEMLAVKVV